MDRAPSRRAWGSGLAALVLACGPAEGDDGEPSRCAAASIEVGLIGQVQERVCDVEGDCLRPASGVSVGLYNRNAQIGSDALGSGTLDPEAIQLASVISGADGTFELELSFGTYFPCAVQGADTVTCATSIVLEQDVPLLTADFEFGNGSGWSIRPCED